MATLYKKRLAVISIISILSLVGIFMSLKFNDLKQLERQKTLPNIKTPINRPLDESKKIEALKVYLDDDPILGNNEAPVTIIEFSDYECPFCKRYVEQAYVQIKKDYIDTGKVKMIYRDNPLPSHEPLATTEAMAANCAREQGSDEAYFKYHDEVFKRTTSNGNGLTIEDLYKIATYLDLNSEKLKECVESDRYRSEIIRDSQDASVIGATGTPTFFIGKSTTANYIDGIKVVGAQPYAVFKAIIDEQLKL